MKFDQLSHARYIARARAEEDFGYFAKAVLGLSLPPDFIEAVQQSVEEQKPVSFSSLTGTPLHVSRSAGRALEAWLCIIGRGSEVLSYSPSDTFSWLFAERVGAAA